MGNRFLNAYVETAKTKEQLKVDVAGMLRSLGGTLYSTPTGFTLVNGNYGVQMSSTANLSANVVVQPIKENKYEIQIYLDWRWGTLMWVVLVLGILLGGIPWLFLLLYLFFDPAPTYQQALARLINFESM
jgi:hypothetical protein